MSADLTSPGVPCVCGGRVRVVHGRRGESFVHVGTRRRACADGGDPWPDHAAARAEETAPVLPA